MNRSVFESKLESVRSSTNSRMNETKDPIRDREANMTESRQEYSRVPSYTSKDYTNSSDSMIELTDSFQTLGFTDNKDKENYPAHTNNYNNNPRSNYNNNFKDQRDFTTSTSDKYSSTYEYISTTLSDMTTKAEVLLNRIGGNSQSHSIQESSNHKSYSMISTAKPIFGSSAYDNHLSESAAKRDSLNQPTNPKYPEIIATKPLNLNYAPKEHQQSKDSNRNDDITTEKVSLRSDAERFAPKQENSTSYTTNLDMKKPDLSEYQESKTLSEYYPKRQFLERGGLPNTGLTCYVNSILQCLFASEPLMKEINDIKWPGESTAIFREIYRYTLARLEYSEWFAVKDLIKDLVSVLGFDDSTEDDAHAFYITLTEKLMEEHVSLDKFFLGELHVTSVCNGCGPINPSEEPFTELALPSKKKCFKRSLSACVEFCFKPTKIECCKCRLSKIRKKNLIIAPEILVLLSEKDVREDIWIEEMISIPMNEDRIRYTLFGIVDYKGSGKFGHYTAITWNQKKRRFFKYDDSSVSDYLLTDRLVNSSLLCFYEKY